MMEVLNPWTDYWQKDRFWSDSELWKINTEIFLKRAIPIVHLQSDDRVLNIGCGKGYLEEKLAPFVSHVLALDISAAFVEQCRNRCAHLPNVSTAMLGPNYTDLQPFGKFSLLFCISVVQYYRDLSEVHSLILSAKNKALPGARMLIADLPVPLSFPRFIRHAAESVWKAVPGGYVNLLIQTWLDLFGQAQAYRNLRKEKPELHFSENEILALTQRLGLRTQIIRKSLSVYAGRPSLLIYF